MTLPDTPDVLILGAGVNGAGLFRDLAAQGVSVVLADKGDYAISSAAILVLIGTANVFGWILVSERIPQAIAGWVLSFTDNRIVVILLINLVLLFVGMFMETIAALIILFVPLLTLATSVGVDPLHFAVFAVLNLMIGLTTPPVGVCLFVCANIARLPLAPVVRAIAPFLICNLIVLMLVSYVPAISTWLPNLIAN